MNVADAMMAAFDAGIDLCIVKGKLVATSPSGPPLPDVLEAIREQRGAILEALISWARNRTLPYLLLASCRPLTPTDLTAAERADAEALAGDLVRSGGVGHFAQAVYCKRAQLAPRDRLAAAYAWNLVVFPAARIESIAA